MTVASLAIVAAPLAASAQSFDHNRGQDRAASGRDHSRDNGRSDRGRGWNDRNSGSALAAGVAGLFLGAALSNSQGYGYGQSYGYAQPYAYDQGYDYGQSYGYSQPYAYNQGYGCGWQTQAFRGRYGNVEYRQVNTCR
jgi:hypothetical protein